MEVPRDYEEHLKEYTDKYIKLLYDEIKENEELVVMVSIDIFDTAIYKDKLIQNTDKDNIFNYEENKDIIIVKTNLVRTIDHFKKDKNENGRIKYYPYNYSIEPEEKSIINKIPSIMATERIKY